MNSAANDIATACVKRLLGDCENVDSLVECLVTSLHDRDPCASASRRYLTALGLTSDTSLVLLAYFRSAAKYGYEPEVYSFEHLLDISRKGAGCNAALAPLDRPAVLMKAGWIYEHSPHFVFRNNVDDCDRDQHVLGYIREYRDEFLGRSWDASEWQLGQSRHRVRQTGFWSRSTIDPVQMIKEAAEQGFEGIELSIDYHPFNYRRLLPEEIPVEKRTQIRSAAEIAGIRLDVHSPIIGPYVPSPNPTEGSQRFFDPVTCMDLQMEAVQFAIDIGAEAIVFHLINPELLMPLAELVKSAEGTNLQVTIENYCQVGTPQTSEVFVRSLDTLWNLLPENIRAANFGVTLDVGHLNVEGEDPLIGAYRIGEWCVKRSVYLRMHATDNYGPLLFGPSYFSADVHASVSGKGIDNGLIVRMLRSLGLAVNVVAEQIMPISQLDMDTVHDAQTATLTKDFEQLAAVGELSIRNENLVETLGERFCHHRAYHFLAGLLGTAELQEYSVLRRIQDNRHLTVDEARQISDDFANMPGSVRANLTRNLDDLHLPIQTQTDSCPH